MNNYESAVKRGWDVADTPFAHAVCDVFAKVDTGFHNLYGRWVCDCSDWDYWDDTLPELFGKMLDEGRTASVEVTETGFAVMRCTNSFGPRLIEAVVAFGRNFEIDNSIGLSGESLDIDILADTEPDEGTRIETDMLGFTCVIRNRFVYPVRPFNTIRIWD